MLKLRDFRHLPELDSLIQKLVIDQPGMMILAGIEARAHAEETEKTFRASGLSAFFNILIQEILLANPSDRAVVIAEERALARVPRQLSRRVRFVRVEPPFSYQGQIDLAVVDRPGLIVIDRLTEEVLPAALRAAKSGLRVLTQMDTVLRGPAVARQLVDMGATQEQLSAVRWIVTNQRMSMLCERCKVPIDSPADLLARFSTRFPDLTSVVDRFSPASGAQNGSSLPAFFRAGGCDTCKGTGYSGEVSVFDLFRNDPAQEHFFEQPSLLSLEEYMLHLAAGGQLDINDLFFLESEHLRRIYQMLTTSERALAESNSKLTRKLLELEASNRVLVQRTEVLMSLQDLGNALISSANLTDLAGRICRRAGELCGADRVVLYLRRSLEDGSEVAEILAERGWGAGMTGTFLEAKTIFGLPGAGSNAMHAARYVQTPPGFRTEIARTNPAQHTIKTGMRVPLVAQNQLVGVMIVQSTQKEFFNQGEAALLQTFANQAALAIQRAGLVDELRAKINQLEAAQAELVKKERMDRELELAREVQQNMLPHSFPEVPGFAISARNEPARQVGGDFYDAFLLDADHFGIVVADVADKGLPAALYMSLTRSLLLAEARRTLSPQETLSNVNRLLLELGELNGFVSIFYGIVDGSSHQLTYTRAGHERPLLLRNGHVSALGGEGAVLGVLEGESLRLTEERMSLENGDLLVLYTDGLTDVLDAAGHFSGLDQLQSVLVDHAGEDAEQFCDAVFDNLSLFRGSAEQFDDMTLLVLKVQ